MKKIIGILLLALLPIFQACENEPIGDMNINRDLVDEELYNLISAVSETNTNTSIDCIEFNYSFAVFVFDENLEFVEAVAITDNFTFSNFLGNLNDTYSISLNYPISGTLNNGELLNINNNQELKDAIDNCVNDELQRRCNNTLVDCIWQVKSLPNVPNDYEGAYFKVNSLGVVQFHFNNNVYFGNWVTLFIGNELFLNIDLNGDSAIEEFWDFNWKVNILSDDVIDISNDGVHTRIEKDCSIPCTTGIYKACEDELNPGFAEFALEKYTTCIGNPPTHNVVSPITYTFYETEIDAANGNNPISPSAYQNIENPQTIYVRIVYTETLELLFLTEITIEAIACG